MKIYSKELKEEILEKLVENVRKGKYKEVGREIVAKEIIKQITNNPKIIDRLEKPKESDKLVKNVRRVLYKGVGAFAENVNIRDYEDIFKITACPKKIVNLGAGLDALAYEKLGCSPEYIAIDINNSHVQKVNQFFLKNKINGKAYCKDILQVNEFPSADVYFMFNLLESIELVKSHLISEELIKKVPAKYVVVSFSTKTLSGNPMRVPKRRWFELMLNRLKYEFNRIDSENEMFYVVKKPI